MITDELITQWYEEKKQLAASYLKGVVDFVKWTSTVGIATMLWIGNSMTSATGSSRNIAFAALVFIASSLIFAIITVGRVLTAWATEWATAQETYSYGVFKKWKAFELSKITELEQDMRRQRISELEKKDAEFAERLLKAVQAAKPFAQTKGFSIWISVHAAFLLLGVSLYVVSQIYNMP
jgi:hypothetical protein